MKDITARVSADSSTPAVAGSSTAAVGAVVVASPSDHKKVVPKPLIPIGAKFLVEPGIAVLSNELYATTTLALPIAPP